MPNSLREALIQQLAMKCYAERALPTDENIFSVIEAPQVGEVNVLTAAEAITVCVGGHTKVRFAVSDYGHVRSSMRVWWAVIDAIEFVEQLIAARD
jgi:hypothetical protein